MRKTSDGLCKTATLKDKIPVKWSEGLNLFCQQVLDRFQVKALILIGSVAKGTWTQASDIDLLVIADDLPSSFFDRLHQLNLMRPCGAPLEILAYTPQEFEEMFKEGHVTALDAFAHGVPLFTTPFMEKLKDAFDQLVRCGLTTSRCSWVLGTSTGDQHEVDSTPVK